jgi:hypothetical protein
MFSLLEVHASIDVSVGEGKGAHERTARIHNSKALDSLSICLDIYGHIIQSLDCLNFGVHTVLAICYLTFSYKPNQTVMKSNID